MDMDELAQWISSNCNSYSWPACDFIKHLLNCHFAGCCSGRMRFMCFLCLDIKVRLGTRAANWAHHAATILPLASWE